MTVTWEQQEPIFFHHEQVVITPAWISVGGRRYGMEHVLGIRLQTTPASLFEWPAFHAVVTFHNATQLSILSSPDSQLVHRCIYGFQQAAAAFRSRAAAEQHAAMMARMAPPPSMVVERQVVVMRCGYCKALTPVDAPTCAHCGAARA